MNDAEKLARLEALIAETRDERALVVERMEKLKAQGKTKSATFQQLLARKMTLDAFMRAFEAHGLVQ
ncbi:MAG: hypothetical protein HFJ66_09385 [Eggerthellaceae bacterium]|nr:hypothetical protein [Eggerthellaceae bacterium]